MDGQALVDSSGNLTTQYTYDPSGNTTATGSASSNAFQYTGRENDANGIYYYRARYYSPTFGRFLSEDPAGFSGSGPNLYGYAGGDPISSSDPTGLAVTISRSPGVVNVNAAIVIYGPGATSALASKFNSAISRAWNNNPGYGTCKVNFNVQVTAQPNVNHWWRVTNNPNFSSYAQNYIYVPLEDVETFVDGNTQWWGQWWRYARLDDIAHEAGHVFGLPDLYNQLTGKAYPGFENDIMASPPGGGVVTSRDIAGILHGRGCGCGK
jgi:RHS repeat-associated protein